MSNTMDVDLVTYCCPKDAHKIHAPGALEAMVRSHRYPFRRVIVVQQNCRGLELEPFAMDCRILESEDYPGIRGEFGIPDHDPIGDKLCPPGTKYHWQNHCQNQLIGLKEAGTEYVAFSDCDIVITGGRGNGWVEEGVKWLQRDRSILMVSPGHGQAWQAIDVISQIAFVCERERFLHINLEMDKGPNPGQFDFVFEGRLQRYARANGLRRLLLGPEWGVIYHYAW